MATPSISACDPESQTIYNLKLQVQQDMKALQSSKEAVQGRECQEAQQRIEKLQRELADAVQVKQSLEKTWSILQKQQQDNQQKSLQQQIIQDLTIKNQNLQSSLDRNVQVFKQEKQQLNQQLQKQEVTIRNLETSLNKANSNVSRIRSELQTAENMLKNQDMTIQNLNASLGNANSNTSRLTGEVQVLKNELGKANKMPQDTQQTANRIDLLQKQVRLMNTERAEANQRSLEQQKIIDTLKNELKESQKDIAHYKSLAETQEKTAKILNEQLLKSMKELDEQDQKLRALSSSANKIQALEFKIRNLEARYEDYETVVEENAKLKSQLKLPQS